MHATVFTISPVLYNLHDKRIRRKNEESIRYVIICACYANWIAVDSLLCREDSHLQAAAGNAFCYFLFSGVALSGVLFVVFILPETKGGGSRFFLRKIFASYIQEYVLFYFGEMLPPCTWRNTHTSWPHPFQNHLAIRNHRPVYSHPSPIYSHPSSTYSHLFAITVEGGPRKYSKPMHLELIHGLFIT